MLTAMGPFSIDMYLPAFPDITKACILRCAGNVVSLGFFIGISVGQLIYGPSWKGLAEKARVCRAFYLSVASGCGPSVNALIAFRRCKPGRLCGHGSSKSHRDLFEVHKIPACSQRSCWWSRFLHYCPDTWRLRNIVTGLAFVFRVLIIICVIILVGIHFLLPESRNQIKFF
jgi:DHA1 family bicyclomycin/chloramphenicol resistance-like MFS transporter